jgi:prepilin-type N-terminal cleavage/methylation domain-containing protein
MGMIQKSLQQSGFTLVELSIVIIIIGLIIGGIFSGAKLRDNAQVLDIVKQLTLYEASAIKFKELYGSLPGDIVDPSARLTNCNAVPCSRAGDGDGSLDTAVMVGSGWNAALITSSERFTFWNHLLMAGLITGIQGTDSTAFGDGQPAADIGGGYRIAYYPYSAFNFMTIDYFPHVFILLNNASGMFVNGSSDDFIPCKKVEMIDGKMDDGFPFNGKVQVGVGCTSTVTSTSVYDVPTGVSQLRYLTKF